MQRKLSYTLFSFALLVALVAFGALVLTPEPSSATHDCLCPSFWQETDPIWGMASTCSAAFDDAQQSAYGLINCPDGTCDIGDTIVVTACHDYQGQKRVDVKVEYKCWMCKFHLPDP